jgi:protein SCO1/2
MVKRLLGLFFAMIILSACTSNEKKVEDSFPLHMNVQTFKAINQDGKSFTASKLKGKVWIANFLFTHCDTVCSPMTANMAKLQQKISVAGLHAEIVSFSIDPDQDNPAILKGYAKGVGANFANWNLLTGYKQEFIESFANKSFMAPAAKLDGSNQFVHSTNFYLVDKDGVVLQKYDGVTSPPYEQIVNDIKKLQ